MADNYLERKMEEYRAGARHTFRLRVKPHQAVFIVNGLCRPELVAEYASRAECAVAFSGEDYRRGCALAQRTSTRFYPMVDAAALPAAIDAARTHYAPLPLTVIDA